jgi:hypothetical protein
MEQHIDRPQAHDTAHEVRMLRSRSASLKAQARALPEPLAVTYRRRAREIALEAYLLENATLAQA